MKALEKCRGCSRVLDEDYYCGLNKYYLLLDKEVICPCAHCLLKAMCSTMCEEREDLYNKVTNNGVYF